MAEQGQGPVYLRWRGGRPAPEQEEFPSLDAALDAVEARWETLQHQAPQLLDARRVLLLSTAELLAMAEEGEEEAGKAG
ncbi:hypothetical protein [Siccirubricoccus phaeus]|uniref:hypothetical protein n=1 Tax=Siccirubricoccus phaeus TaxID=2595053 RepID=UPI0011F16688|nr:hypothetical protein [Siccirubricoccus phaeus]